MTINHNLQLYLTITNTILISISILTTTLSILSLRWWEEHQEMSAITSSSRVIIRWELELHQGGEA